MSVQKSARETAEAKFAAKTLRDQEARRAMSEYEADNRRVAEKTARLKALRLAREAAETEAKPAAARRSRRSKASR